MVRFKNVIVLHDTLFNTNFSLLTKTRNEEYHGIERSN
jgi:hypothetical protein